MRVSINLDRKSAKYLAYLKAQDKQKLYDDLLSLFGRQSSIIAGKVSRSVAEGGRIGRRSGTLARSIVGDSGLYQGVPSLRVGILRGPALRYAAVQELGTKRYNSESPIGTIRPRSAKALAFAPKGSPAVFPSGVPKYESPRQYPRTLRYVPFRANSGVAVGALYDAKEYDRKRRQDSANSKGFSLRGLQAVYILLKELDLRPRFFLRDGFDEQLPALAESIADLLEMKIAG